VQLQRLAELAGMKERVDFDLQKGVGDGRPDMIVWLPRGGCIVVDAKAPMQHYLEALECTSEDGRTKNLGEHARRVKQHVDSLGGKTTPATCRRARSLWSCTSPATPV
jgi:DNA recombination protein RmuC